MHSLFSDGSDTPERLIELAVAGGLSAVALTDHDTVKGVPRFMAAAESAAVEAISGVEVSTSTTEAEMHLLGYFMDPADSTLASQLDVIRSARQTRNEHMLENLQKLGLPLDESEIRAFAGDDVIGRPHFAQAMVARGYCKTTREAFDLYLGSGRPGYARRQTLVAEEAIEMIRAAGGVAVVAHPFTLGLSDQELSDLLGRLRSVGLGGLEIYYSQHTPEQVQTYSDIAAQHDLVASGGTDYHGSMTPDYTLGRGFGSLHVPDELVERLRDRCT